MTNQPKIFIAMPLFHGWEHVGHTLETIQKQTYQDYCVLISVDGSDTRSYEACQPFLADPRFNIVLQPEKLGWAGNMNYLSSRFMGEYFCYWQHDDYCAPTYLQTLLDYADAHPEASAVYCDMQVLDERNHIIREPSVRGFDLERILNQARKPNVAAIRCLIRAEALRASLPIQVAGTWVLPLARSGEFHRIPELLYFRRIRKDSVTQALRDETPIIKWRATMDRALAVVVNVRPLIGDHEITFLFIWVIDMLVTNRFQGAVMYKFAAANRKLQVKFVHQLLEEISSTAEYRPWPNVPEHGLEHFLREKLDAKEPLRKGELLLMEAALARDVLSDEAIVTGYVQLENPKIKLRKKQRKKMTKRSKPYDRIWRAVVDRLTRLRS